MVSIINRSPTAVTAPLPFSHSMSGSVKHQAEPMCQASSGTPQGIELSGKADVPSAASGYVCLGDDAAEPLVIGVVVAPDDVPADHAGLFLVAGVVGAVQREVPQRRELRLYAV